MFYIGSLEAASQEAFYGKARDVSELLLKANCKFECLFLSFLLRLGGWDKRGTKVCIILVYP